MIELSDCMALRCADTLMRRYREHLKEEKKKNKEIKHVCGEACHQVEREAHQKLHDWYATQKK